MQTSAREHLRTRPSRRIDTQALVDDQPGAWQQFLGRFDPLIRGAILRTLHDYRVSFLEDDVEDIRARFLAELWIHRERKLLGFDPTLGRSLASWLRFLVGRCTVDHLRRLPRQALLEPTDVGRDHEGRTPEQLVADKQEVDLVQRAVRRLPRRQREQFALQFESGLTPEVIAARTGTTVQTVYSRRHKLTVRLARTIGGSSPAPM